MLATYKGRDKLRAYQKLGGDDRERATGMGGGLRRGSPMSKRQVGYDGSGRPIKCRCTTEAISDVEKVRRCRNIKHKRCKRVDDIRRVSLDKR